MNVKYLKLSDLRKAIADKAMKGFTERFWANVKKSEHGCWEWQGLPRGGKILYGQIAPPGYGRQIVAHRAAWLLHYGEIPLREQGPHSLVIRHTCDNPKCVRIDHLVLGTQLDNIHDMQERGRANYARGEEAGGAKLTAVRVIELRKRYAAGGITMRALAKLESMSYSGMQQLLSGRTWKHLSTEKTH